MTSTVITCWLPCDGKQFSITNVCSAPVVLHRNSFCPVHALLRAPEVLSCWAVRGLRWSSPHSFCVVFRLVLKLALHLFFQRLSVHVQSEDACILFPRAACLNVDSRALCLGSVSYAVQNSSGCLVSNDSSTPRSTVQDEHACLSSQRHDLPSSCRHCTTLQSSVDHPYYSQLLFAVRSVQGGFPKRCHPHQRVVCDARTKFWFTFALARRERVAVSCHWASSEQDHFFHPRDHLCTEEFGKRGTSPAPRCAISAVTHSSCRGLARRQLVVAPVASQTSHACTMCCRSSVTNIHGPTVWVSREKKETAKENGAHLRLTPSCDLT